jgi:hypothetical protein
MNPEKFRSEMKFLMTTDQEFIAAAERDYSSKDLWVGADANKVLFFGLTQKEVFLGISRKDTPRFVLSDLSEVRVVRVTDPTLKKPLPIRLELYDYNKIPDLPFVSLSVGKKFTDSFFAQVHGGMFDGKVKVETITWDEYVETRQPKVELPSNTGSTDPMAVSTEPSLVSKIRELNELYQSGVLTETEFAAAKAKLLG